MPGTIDELRAKINKIDATIIKKLAERNRIAVRIGKIKAESKMEITDKKREKELMQFYKNLCVQYQLEFTYIKKLFKLIFKNSKKNQTELITLCWNLLNNI